MSPREVGEKRHLVRTGLGRVPGARPWPGVEGLASGHSRPGSPRWGQASDPSLCVSVLTSGFWGPARLPTGRVIIPRGPGCAPGDTCLRAPAEYWPSAEDAGLGWTPHLWPLMHFLGGTEVPGATGWDLPRMLHPEGLRGKPAGHVHPSLRHWIPAIGVGVGSAGPWLRLGDLPGSNPLSNLNSTCLAWAIKN